jgi:hypothetical protein
LFENDFYYSGVPENLFALAPDIYPADPDNAMP